MQVAAAGTGVHLSDGSTNILPVGDRRQRARGVAAARAAWSGVAWSAAIYQGWDLHPGQLPPGTWRTYAFYREGFAPRRGAPARLRAPNSESASWTSRPPPARWPAICTAASSAAPWTSTSCAGTS